MNNIKVSIIIPIYNTSKYLEKCLNSVINQTLKEIEIICVDDKSTDDSLNILKEFKKKYDKDNKMIIIEQNKNMGGGVAKNVAFDIAKGEYIGFVDSDDFVDLSYFKELYIKANQYNVNVVCIDVNGNLKVVNVSNQLIDINSSTIKFMPKSTSSFFLKNNFIKKYKLKFETHTKIGEDLYFYHIVLSILYENKEKLYALNTAKYYLIGHISSITKVLDRTEIFKAIDAIYDNYKKRNLLDKLPISLYEHEIDSYFCGFDKNKMYNEARKLFLKISQDNLIRWSLYDKNTVRIITEIITYDNYEKYKKNRDNEEIKNELKKINTHYDRKIKIFGITLFTLKILNSRYRNHKIKVFLFGFIPLMIIKKNEIL